MLKAYEIEIEYQRLPPVYNQGKRSKTALVNYNRAQIEMVKYGLDREKMNRAMVVFIRRSFVKMSPETVKMSMDPFYRAAVDLKFAKKIEPVFKWEKGQYGRGSIIIEVREI